MTLTVITVGAPTGVFVALEQMQQLRAAKAQRAIAEAQAAAAQQGADVAKTAAEAGRMTRVA